MRPKLPQVIFLFCILCLVLAFFADLPFFLYVKTFGILPQTYDTIDAFLQNSIPFLALPASFALFRLFKLRQLGTKPKLALYILYGLLSPYLFFQLGTAFSGQLSSDYQTFSTLALSRFYLRFYIVSLPTLFIWPLVTKVVKRFLTNLGLSLLSLAITAIVVGISVSTMGDLLHRLLFQNKVEHTLPELTGYTNQPLVVADNPTPLLSCYLKQDPTDLSARLLSLIMGASSISNLDYNSYYLNDHCLVIYFGAPLTLENNQITESSALLSELLIRLTFGDHIKVNADKHPASTITVKDAAFFTTGSSRGTYDSDTNTIELQSGYSLALETITHELLHSFAVPHESWLGYEHAGLSEAITHYLTGQIMRRASPAYITYTYKEQVAALEKLLPYIDEATLIDTYFNGNLRSLEKAVDKKTYPGAFCRFNHYLDQSLTEYLDTKNFGQSKALTAQAEQALEVKTNDNLGCL